MPVPTHGEQSFEMGKMVTHSAIMAIMTEAPIRHRRDSLGGGGGTNWPHRTAGWPLCQTQCASK